MSVEPHGVQIPLPVDFALQFQQLHPLWMADQLAQGIVHQLAAGSQPRHPHCGLDQLCIEDYVRTGRGLLGLFVHVKGSNLDTQSLRYCVYSGIWSYRTASSNPCLPPNIRTVSTGAPISLRGGAVAIRPVSAEELATMKTPEPEPAEHRQVDGGTEWKEVA
jgi:hypothetical protein